MFKLISLWSCLSAVVLLLLTTTTTLVKNEELIEVNTVQYVKDEIITRPLYLYCTSAFNRRTSWNVSSSVTRMHNHIVVQNPLDGDMYYCKWSVENITFIQRYYIRYYNDTKISATENTFKFPDNFFGLRHC